MEHDEETLVLTYNGDIIYYHFEITTRCYRRYVRGEIHQYSGKLDKESRSQRIARKSMDLAYYISLPGRGQPEDPRVKEEAEQYARQQHQALKSELAHSKTLKSLVKTGFREADKDTQARVQKWIGNTIDDWG